jgi:CRISPR-associated protein Cmr5
MSHVTLEQQRAADAWMKAQGCSKEYRNLAKGLPALIMNSGLMQVLAFLHEKGGKKSQEHCGTLGNHLRQWLHARFKTQLHSADFKPFMLALMAANPQLFQQVTTEAMAWLRWSRQMAAAVCADKED